MGRKILALVSGYYLLNGCGAVEKAASSGDLSTVVAVSFLTPSEDGLFADKSLAVEILQSGTNKDALWDLYYTRIAGEKTGGTLIASGLKFNNPTYDWDTSKLPAGSYYLYAELFGNEEQTLAAARGPVRVAHPEAGNEPPSLLLANLEGREVLESASLQEIEFNITDPDDDPLTFTFEVSANGGRDYQEITGGSLNDQGGGDYSYTWDISDEDTYAQPAIGYRVRVRADDGRGGIVEDMSKFNFAIAAEIPTFTSLTNNGFFTANCSCHTNDNPGGFDANDYYGSVWGRGDLSYRNNIADKVLGTGAMLGKAMPNTGKMSDTAKSEIVIFVWGGVPH